MFLHPEDAERRGIVAGAPIRVFNDRDLYLSYNNPAIEPLGEAVSNTELFRRLRPEKMRVLNSWRLGPALTGDLGFDPPIKALFVYNANPMAMMTEQAKLEQGLEREDLFTVVSEHFLTDTARYADIVLPIQVRAACRQHQRQ